ncbi:DEAD/DEAH box helicase [Candidatus Micrarchaeota archaeon]|nr:DEAD/DEAH box helicase [Candidatus Micrarchaeota archaeon]MBU1930383.1 DEAD/DEAH box helicase [Candidatus Micrarchaeota archaeon]
MNFDEFGLNKQILKGIQEAGFKEPTEIQVETIPLMLKGKDIVGQAKTGTGKTAAFALPLLQLIEPQEKNIKALIIVPVRELSQQVSRELSLLGKHCGVHSTTIYGGQSINIQLSALRQKPQVIAGTPGRLIDLYQRRALDFSKLGVVILDEADKMFEMGFREDIEKILSYLPANRQTLLFSATMSQEIKELARRFMKKPVELNLSEDTLTVEGVKQYYMMINPRKKVGALVEILDTQHVQKGLIFCRTKRTVDWLSRELKKRRVDNVALHGDFPQAKREKTLELFKKGSIQLLIATNVAARGLHIEDVSHVINFELPEEDETYVHRIGRTARQGKKGVAITFLENVFELERLQRIQRLANSFVEELESKYKY